MKCCINEQRPDQKSEQAPMTRYSQADLVGGCLTVKHAKDRSRGYKLKECDRRKGAGDDQNEFNVCTDHRCHRFWVNLALQHSISDRTLSALSLGHLRLLDTHRMTDRNARDA